jgi:hypothetical protein
MMEIQSERLIGMVRKCHVRVRCADTIFAPVLAHLASLSRAASGLSTHEGML